MGTKRLLVSIALSSMLVAYDFDAIKFQSTNWSEFQKQETTAPFYVWKNQNGNPPSSTLTGVGVGFRFSGENIYFTKDNTILGIAPPLHHKIVFNLSDQQILRHLRHPPQIKSYFSMLGI
ncbi:MAG: hypothetical protein MR591_06485 [Helicobacter sp.]|uniref:hypothetical protein n=1 Tax=Helicobacter sp. TaxID=218 RepID=UPI0037501D42|nr:hypothetical protein [Helicobacter sp.]